MNSNFLIRVLLYIAMLIVALYFVYVLIPAKTKTSPPKTHIPIQVEYINEDQHIEEALTYCDSFGYRKDFAILIDLSSHSGNYRLFTYDLTTKDTLMKALVTHGHCQSTDNRLAQFSNTSGSNCSSLGHYKVGEKYQGEYGTSYKLHGLDTSNSNALNRYVVLHSHECVPIEPQEDDICLSEGCTTVNPEILALLEKEIDNSTKPILLWVYH